MSSLFPPTLQTAPRASSDTDRRHLLTSDDDDADDAATSDVPDENDEGNLTPRARPFPSSSSSSSQPQSQRRETLSNPHPRPYRGFASEAAYLAALHEWAESKRYVSHDTRLVGFYGAKTMEEYARAEGPRLEGLGLRRMWRARRERKASEAAAAVAAGAGAGAGAGRTDAAGTRNQGAGVLGGGRDGLAVGTGRRGTVA